MCSCLAEMSDSAQAHVVEEVHLSLLPGSGETQGNNNTSDQAIAEQSDTSCINDRYHRKLAICSIICGISCIGIKALINSAKVFSLSASQNVKAAHLNFPLPNYKLQRNDTVTNVIWKLQIHGGSELHIA